MEIKNTIWKEWKELSDKLDIDAEDGLTKKDIEKFMKSLKDKFLDKKVLDVINDKDKKDWIIIINKLLSASKKP